MDPTRFDTLIRTIADASRGVAPRRAVLAALGGFLAGSLTEDDETRAKRRHPRVRGRVRRRKRKKDRKRKRRCPTGQVRCEGGCAGCCSDADCGGNACRDGQCADCPRAQRLCRGGCIAEDACCTDAECTGGQVCVDGVCGCRANERLCNGTCIPSDECCGSDCPPPPTCSAENCNGCCDGTNCRQGDSQNFCGRDGVACVPCAAGETCDAGQCHSTNETCTSENCNGCCDGTRCRQGDSQNFCGRAGDACTACAQRETCDAGQCVCAEECCADADCVDPSEQGGLCKPDGTCVYEPFCLAAGDHDDPGCPSAGVPCCGLCRLGDGLCIAASNGHDCHTDADCESGNCSFYVCRP